MLEPIRAVALDQLDQAGVLEQTRERLAAHVYDASVAMLRESVTRWDADLLPTLIARFDQIDVALRHCLDNDDEPTRTLLLYGVLWGIVHQARVDEVLTLGAAVVERWPDSSRPPRRRRCGHLRHGPAPRRPGRGGADGRHRRAAPHRRLGAGGAEPAPGPRPRRAAGR